MHLFASCGRRSELLALRPTSRQEVVGQVTALEGRPGRRWRGVAIPTGEEQTRPVISPRRWLETPGIAGCVFCRIATGISRRSNAGRDCLPVPPLAELDGNFAGHSQRGSFATGGRRGPADPKLQTCAAGAGRASGEAAIIFRWDEQPRSRSLAVIVSSAS
jgi:hypothetical protein